MLAIPIHEGLEDIIPKIMKGKIDINTTEKEKLEELTDLAERVYDKNQIQTFLIEALNNSNITKTRIAKDAGISTSTLTYYQTKKSPLNHTFVASLYRKLHELFTAIGFPENFTSTMQELVLEKHIEENGYENITILQDQKSISTILEELREKIHKTKREITDKTGIYPKKIRNSTGNSVFTYANISTYLTALGVSEDTRRKVLGDISIEDEKKNTLALLKDIPDNRITSEEGKLLDLSLEKIVSAETKETKEALGRLILPLFNYSHQPENMSADQARRTTYTLFRENLYQQKTANQPLSSFIMKNIRDQMKNPNESKDKALQYIAECNKLFSFFNREHTHSLSKRPGGLIYIFITPLRTLEALEKIEKDDHDKLFTEIKKTFERKRNIKNTIPLLHELYIRHKHMSEEQPNYLKV